jgi:hypothetical protein
MLDDLRNSASKSFQEDEEEDPKQAPAPRHEVIRLQKPHVERAPFLGMTAQQRFVIALLLFMMVSVMGVLVLVAAEKVFPF